MRFFLLWSTCVEYRRDALGRLSGGRVDGVKAPPHDGTPRSHVVVVVGVVALLLRREIFHAVEFM